MNPSPYCLLLLLLFVVLEIISCGPGAQNLERQRRQLTALKQQVAQNRRLIEQEKQQVAQAEQRPRFDTLTPATHFIMRAVALRTDAVAGNAPATKILAAIPGTDLLTNGSKADDTLPLVWGPFFENAVVKFERLDSPAPVALYYNPLLDVAVFSQWEKQDRQYRVVSLHALPGERLADPSAAVEPRPYWMEADEGPIEALSRIAAERLEAFGRIHSVQAGRAKSAPTALADMRAALPRLLWNTVHRAQWEDETAWLQPTLVSIDTALNARDAATLMAAAPATDAATATAFSGLPEGFAERLRLDMVLDGDEQERILISSLPDDGDIYVFIVCRLDGRNCALQRFLLAPLLGDEEIERKES